MRIYKILSVLLQYPEQELIEHLPEIAEWADSTHDIDPRAHHSS
ncbi:MAG: hypothetical protein Q9N32_00545 [Gammaproteobacteria bacterium]|nr:hypothetical protein [Gammaproteobacteria bacterium]